MHEEMEEKALPDDVAWEILLRAPTDAAALFRCAATCKQWRAIVADLSFLRHHWPENACHPSSLLGFFDRRRRHHQERSPFFFPLSPGSVLGACRRSLASFVSRAPLDGILNGAVPLSSRGGLLLMRLATITDSLHLAVCDVLTGTCDVLPPLEYGVSQYACVVLPREDCWSLDGEQQGRQTPLTGYSTFFKVLAVVTGTSTNFKERNLYTFSSLEPNWSDPRKCFDEVSERNKFGLRIRHGIPNRVVVCRGVAYWLVSYLTDQWNLLHYTTFGVNIKTGQISIAELSIPANQLATISHHGVMLSVAVDGRLSLFHFQKEGLRLNQWIQENDGTWLRTRVIKLKSPGQAVWNSDDVAVLSGEKSDMLFIADVDGRVHKIDPETGVMEDLTMGMFQDSLGIMPVPMEIDWPTVFMLRLAKGYD